MHFEPQAAHVPGYSRKPGKRRRQEACHSIDQQFPYHTDRRMDGNQPPPPPPGRQIQFRMDDKKAQAKWFSDAFKAVQQVGCRTIAKVWIKKIHPKKVSVSDALVLALTYWYQQSTHPYNGLFPRDQPADANRTRPPYWPPGCVIHRKKLVCMLTCIGSSTRSLITLTAAVNFVCVQISTAELTCYSPDSTSGASDHAYTAAANPIPTRCREQRHHCSRAFSGPRRKEERLQA